MIWLLTPIAYPLVCFIAAVSTFPLIQRGYRGS